MLFGHDCSQTEKKADYAEFMGISEVGEADFQQTVNVILSNKMLCNRLQKQPFYIPFCGNVFFNNKLLTFIKLLYKSIEI